MRRVTVFEANDGTRFDTIEGAEKHERECALARSVMVAVLGEPRFGYGAAWDAGFSNGEHYVQHRRNAKIDMREALQRAGAGDISRSWDDKAWHLTVYRFQCLDSQGREWGQPYFANNPNREATEI